ncbi:MAG: NifB/NifX family molybdenum-iron cluster-binding protein, partial [Halococcoides sp.]
MLVCVPSLEDGTRESPLSPHFGRAPSYSLVDTETGAVEVIENDGHHQGGHRSPPNIIAESGADALVVGNLGQRAVQRFDEMEIAVYCGAEGTVGDAIEQFEDEALDMATPDGAHCGGHDEDG